jgi:methanethiol S-methyltransferase
MWLTLTGMIIYGAVHSALAGWFKPHFRARFGDRAYHGLYRIVFNAVATVTLVPVVLLILTEQENASPLWRLPASIDPLLWIVRLIGLAGVALSLLQIDTGRFLGVSQLRAYLAGAALPLPDEPLVTGGLYSLVRHPLYLFSLLVIWPVQVMTPAYFGFCAGTTVYFIVGSLYEERRLFAGYGQPYLEYRRRVGWLVPLLHRPGSGGE